MSTDYFPDDAFDEPAQTSRIHLVHAPGFPPPRHPAEADVFARHDGVPGHRQEALMEARVVLVGAGGLGSWAALALGRTGIRTLTIVDPDRFDRSNASRQLMFGDDLGRPKAFALADNVAIHMIAGGTVTGIWGTFEMLQECAIPADLLIVVVDSNACRFQTAEYARKRGIAAVFSMLSRDSMRMHTFLQGPDAEDACLWCAVPDLDPAGSAPCAAGIITACLLSAAHVTFFAHRALMGWDNRAPFNWRTGDVSGLVAESAGQVLRRVSCFACEQGG